MADKMDLEEPGTLGERRPPVPSLEIRYENLNYTIKVEAHHARTQIPSVLGVITNIFLGPPKAIATAISNALAGKKSERQPRLEDFRVLEDVSGE